MPDFAGRDTRIPQPTTSMVMSGAPSVLKKTRTDSIISDSKSSTTVNLPLHSSQPLLALEHVAASIVVKDPSLKKMRTIIFELTVSPFERKRSRACTLYWVPVLIHEGAARSYCTASLSSDRRIKRKNLFPPADVITRSFPLLDDMGNGWIGLAPASPFMIKLPPQTSLGSGYRKGGGRPKDTSSMSISTSGDGPRNRNIW
mmetsp:Transcript_11816/g.24005  ORF Transcript_11816/g.24005 Transcript_11816/m.24005 type:complete len:201 (-) Transcript_11816:1296-1898(-)